MRVDHPLKDFLKRALDLSLLAQAVKRVVRDDLAVAQEHDAVGDAFDEFGALVPRVYVASLMAGERSGNLETVLRRYVAYARLMGSIRRKTISALMYPAILVLLAVVVVGIIVFKLVPAFSDFYASFGSELPAMTRAILAIANFANSYWLVLLAGIVGGVWAVTTWRSPRNCSTTCCWRAISTETPVASTWAATRTAARSCTSLAPPIL